MNKQEFKELFLRALEMAAETAEKMTNRKVSRNFRILLYGADHSGDEMSLDEALEVLYIDENKFYRIVDLSVEKVGKNNTRIFTRISSHEPSRFDLTWNQPEGFGPFKQLIANQITFE